MTIADAGYAGRTVLVFGATGALGGGLAAGLGDDAFQQCGGRLGPGRLQHLHPGGAALSVRQHGGATGASSHVEIKGGLLRGREGAVECVGEHSFTLGAVLRVTGSARGAGLLAAELVEVCHFRSPVFLAPAFTFLPASNVDFQYLCFCFLSRFVACLFPYTTCLSIRCRSLASSPRPRLMRLLTVPSGMRRTCDISL